MDSILYSINNHRSLISTQNKYDKKAQDEYANNKHAEKKMCLNHFGCWQSFLDVRLPYILKVTGSISHLKHKHNTELARLTRHLLRTSL